MAKTITVRNLSPETKAELKRRAAAKGQSLEAYVRDLFIKLANTPDPLVIAARARENATLESAEQPNPEGSPGT